MIVLDTNVISELSRGDPSPAVGATLTQFPNADLRITTITVCELLYGIATMPSGRRREQVAEGVGRILNNFVSRTLPFDAAAVPHYVTIAVRHRQLGFVLPVLDAQIAAIALAHSASIVTRNVKDFRHFQVPLINPWEEAL